MKEKILPQRTQRRRREQRDIFSVILRVFSARSAVSVFHYAEIRSNFGLEILKCQQK